MFKAEVGAEDISFTYYISKLFRVGVLMNPDDNQDSLNFHAFMYVAMLVREFYFPGLKHELFKQRRDAIETDGWEPYQEWFYDNEFRTWWQVMGCTGVPLYKIYQRKTQWRTERPPEAPEEADTSSGLVRNDSVDDMIAQVLKKKF